MSLAANADPGGLRGETCETTTDGMRRAVCAATKAGISVVASAGNDETDLMTTAPAMFPEVLAVTAMDDTDHGRPGGCLLLFR